LPLPLEPELAPAGEAEENELAPLPLGLPLAELVELTESGVLDVGVLALLALLALGGNGFLPAIRFSY
jgi:hypothetical protein